MDWELKQRNHLGVRTSSHCKTQRLWSHLHPTGLVAKGKPLQRPGHEQRLYQWQRTIFQQLCGG